MAKNEYQRLVAHILGARLISYNSDLARALGSIKASILLNQLLFWCGKGRDPEWLYKTVKELEEETTLTPKEQIGAIKVCVKLGFIEIKRKGIPPKRYFRIDMDKIVEFMRKFMAKK